MKTKRIRARLAALCILAAAAISAVPVAAQTAAAPHADSARIAGSLTLNRAEELRWMTRYQGEIDRFADLNRESDRATAADPNSAQTPTRACDVLFVGSSSIRMWHTLELDMAPLRVVSRAYGGATIRDMIYNYDVIARGFRPRAVVLLCNNDIAGDAAHDLTPGDAYDWFRVFAGLVRRDCPGVPLVVISVTPSFAREAALEGHRRLNALLRDWADTTPLVHYIDLTAPMYDADGWLRDDIFLPDRLHVNPAGYALWTAVLQPALMGIVHGE